MDYVSGGELFVHLQREECFSEERSRFYAAMLILALEHLHRHKIIYRDLKPENVLVDMNGYLKVGSAPSNFFFSRLSALKVAVAQQNFSF